MPSAIAFLGWAISEKAGSDPEKQRAFLGYSGDMKIPEPTKIAL
jgi:hypothetical protein